MRYLVKLAGGGEHTIEIEETAAGLTARVAGQPAEAARLVPAPQPLHVLEWGRSRATVAVVPGEEDGTWGVALEGRPALAAEVVDARFAKVLQRGEGAQRRLKKLKSPMPGVIVEVRVEPGQAVSKGQVLLILEAMKMQNEIRAEGEGVVKTVKVVQGDSVPAGGLLIDFG